jgi:hypothetical protein
MTEWNVASVGAACQHGTVYRIRVEGPLDELVGEAVLGERFLDDADDLMLAQAVEPGGRAVSTLTCGLPDQEALVGLVNLLHGRDLSLVSIERLTARDVRGLPAE